jgi:acid phosphatase family membrane protein YuiD
VKVGGSQSKASPRQKLKTLSEKITKAKRVGGIPSKHEALSSSLSTAKKKKKKKVKATNFLEKSIL